MAKWRQSQSAEAESSGGQHLAILTQIPGEEDDEADFQQLRGLQIERPDSQHVAAGAVEADRARMQEGDGDEAEPQERPSVFVEAEPIEGARGPDRQPAARPADDNPGNP